MIMRERRPAISTDPVTEYESFEHFLVRGQVPAGRFSILHEGVPVDFVYEPVENAKTTVVFFHGSTKRDVSLPSFAGSRIVEGIPVNRLAISDPSLTADRSYRLTLSWFVGSERQPNLQYFLETVIRRIFEITGVRHRIFMGSSGGGFASLEMSRRFSDSLALVMNPQVVLPNYRSHLVERYVELCWPGTDSIHSVPGHVVTDNSQVYGPVLTNTVGYIQNTRDDHHVENHQIPFMKKAESSRRVFMLMDAWGDPRGKAHVIPPTEVVQNVLSGLVDAKGAWWRGLTEVGFSRDTSPSTIRRVVESANAGLPAQEVLDTM